MRSYEMTFLADGFFAEEPKAKISKTLRKAGCKDIKIECTGAVGRHKKKKKVTYETATVEYDKYRYRYSAMFLFDGQEKDLNSILDKLFDNVPDGAIA